MNPNREVCNLAGFHDFIQEENFGGFGMVEIHHQMVSLQKLMNSIN